MNTITAVLTPDMDGTVHVPLPPEFHSLRQRLLVVASFQIVGDDEGQNPAHVPALVHTQHVLKPDWDAMDRQVYGDKEVPDI